MQNALKEVGINQRDNPDRVLWYLQSVKIYRMANWCAAFARKMMDVSGVDFRVRSGVAQHYIVKNSIDAKDVLKKKVSVPKGSLVIWKRGKTWQGHMAINREEWEGESGFTVEGNTSSKATRTGGNVEQHKRRIEPYNYFRITHFTFLC